MPNKKPDEIGEYQDIYHKKLPPWKEWGPQQQERTLREAIGDELYEYLEELIANLRTG